MTDQRTIYLCSDGVGETAEAVTQATIRQFAGERVRLKRYAPIKDEDEIAQVVTEAEATGGFIAFTLVQPELSEKMREEAAERNELKGDAIAAGFGSRIRSYVLHPYTQVTDHRTEVSVGDAQGVLNGNLDPFIEGWLQHLVTPADEE